MGERVSTERAAGRGVAPEVPAGRFELLPAIDLRGGRVVRLRHGDFRRETVYGDDPIAVAEGFVAAGARWLHVVDLDGARDGDTGQRGLVRAIVERVGERAACQVAGGLRDETAVAAILRDGAARVVVGTAALADPGFAGRLVRTHGPERIAVALDVRAGEAVGEGWRPGAPGAPVEQALLRLADAGVGWFAVTSIDRDGALHGPDLGLVGRLVALRRGAIIASAGIRSLEDVVAARAAGAAGAIVGRALYEGRLELASALNALAVRDRPA